ncbi:HAD-IIIA family hydrolase [Candidatus Pelagibacter sp.]|nr:HAD-IIIA family hydrolase [Candidatus Pelagibacter sp.]
MKVDDLVILVGGRGSRIGKITIKTPKPLIKINKKPFLDQLIANKLKYEFKRIFLLCSFKKDLFFKKYHNKKIHKSKIVCIDEGSGKDTAGALYLLRNTLKKKFVLINGDTFFDIDMNELFKQNLKKKIACIALTKINNKQEKIKIKNLNLNKKKEVYFSKSKTNIINGGIYLFDRRIFKFIKNRPQSLENDIFRKLIKKNQVKGILSKRNFIDIGSYKKLDFLKKNPSYIQNKAFFLDRDGVINKENGYVLKYSQFFFLSGVKEAIRYINNKNYLVIILTNQSAVGQGFLTELKLNKIHQKMMKELFNNTRSKINDIYFAPYFKKSKYQKYRKNSGDRKPNIGMFKKALEKWNIDIKKSFFIGDKKTDYLASKKAHIKFFYRDKGSFYKQVRKII